MKEHVDSLNDYLQMIGHPPVERTENGTLVIRHALTKVDLGNLDKARLGAFLTLFGDSVQCMVSRMVGTQSIDNLKLCATVLANGTFERYLADMPADGNYQLRTTIDKAVLLKSIFGAFEETILFYFDSTPLLTQLNSDLLTIENAWFSKRGKVFLLLGDRDLMLVGDVLHVFGRIPEQTIKHYVSQPLTVEEKQKHQGRLSIRAAETHWQNGPRLILPEHLRVRDETPGGDKLFKPGLNKHFLDLTIAGLANYTRPEGSGLIVLFEGQKRLEVGPNDGSPVSDEVCNGWFRIYDWAYENRTRDKLSIIRNLVTLQPYTSADKNLGVITSKVDMLSRSAQDHYVKFIGESIKEYFDKLKEAATYVQSKVDAVGQQVNGLVDVFTKNLLALAGFVIGTVLAKLIDQNLARIYPLIAVAFVIYMGVVLLVYYPLTLGSFILTSREYNHSLALYRRSFTEEDVNTFIGNSFRGRRVHFWIAYIATFLVHLLLLILAYLAHRRGWLTR